MLTSNLLRARVRKDEILPDYIAADDPDLLGLAEMLIDAFGRHVGQARLRVGSGA